MRHFARSCQLRGRSVRFQQLHDSGYQAHASVSVPTKMPLRQRSRDGLYGAGVGVSVGVGVGVSVGVAVAVGVGGGVGVGVGVLAAGVAVGVRPGVCVGDGGRGVGVGICGPVVAVGATASMVGVAERPPFVTSGGVVAVLRSCGAAP